MYYVYILISRRDLELYVGCTSDFENRLALHNTGKVDATKYRHPLDILHLEEIADKTGAFNRERFLKSLWSARFKRKLKEKYLARPK